MKSICLSFLIVICFCLDLSSQYEWAPVGAKWYINDLAYVGWNDPNLWNQYTLVECTGDTVVGGYAGRKVGDWIMVQDGYKVYVWWNDTLRLQYDYSLEVGDTTTFQLLDPSSTGNLFQPYPFIVEDIDTIDVNGYALRVFYTKGNNDLNDPWSSFFWDYGYMEKLGSLNTIVEEAAFLYHTSDHIPAFIRCYEDVDLLWKHDWFMLDCDYSKPSSIDFPLWDHVSLSPNPARSVIHLRVDAPQPHWPEMEVHLLRPDGVVLFSTPFVLANQELDIPVSSLPSGIYFLRLTDVAGQVLGVEKVVIE